VARHVGADHRSVVAAARIETARIIALAGFGLFRLGVAQQDQTHGISIDLSRGSLEPFPFRRNGNRSTF
jgi:hypothetical protein